jgi:2-polyprenyl-6-methoxyphenol hydroxylase-like FAD-dependent oxidoreductase
MHKDTDVLIVGAGPVGLTLANDLAARGISFRIVDLLPEATCNSRAHGLQSRTLEVLDRLNLAEPRANAGGRSTAQPPLLILSDKTVVARINFTSFPHEPYPFSLIIWQQRIERVLEVALAKRGHRVERPRRLLKLEMDAEGTAAHLQCAGHGSNIVRASWVVGCDGGHSTVREQLGLKMEGTTLPGRFWLGEFDLDWTRSRDAMYQWWYKGGMAAALFIDFTNKWHLYVGSERIPQGAPDLARMQALFREHTGEFDATLSNPSWISALTINQRMPNSFIVGRSILAGDAAHVHSGAGGQGMNTGIQDALNLGWKLALRSQARRRPLCCKLTKPSGCPTHETRSETREDIRCHR